MTTPQPITHGPCAWCARTRQGNGTLLSPGHVRHGAGDLCDSCAQRKRRGLDGPARPRDDGPPRFDGALPPVDVLEQALCAQVDPEEWYPEKGGSNRNAKAICGRCPVRQACLDYAMATETGDHHRHGIWGGLSARERAALARQQGQAA